MYILTISCDANRKEHLVEGGGLFQGWAKPKQPLPPPPGTATTLTLYNVHLPYFGQIRVSAKLSYPPFLHWTKRADNREYTVYSNTRLIRNPW